MAKPKMKLVSNFRAAEKAGHEAVALAIHHAVDEGQETAAKRLDMQAGKRGYDLQGSDVEKEAWAKDGKISYAPFYGKWFEYGTVHIQAMPFIRPGHRRMRKVFIAAMGADFEKWISRRAGMRQR
jgi:hypothetical protein